ncbi:hypothetical protein DKX38_012119 [Salix brachista]|uniref:RING-type domain-containing protein n=1 Tax=Salix brachista TaxID=2182728 RepID=A0A5N5LMP5_9ROSI|nr:hypothetical protein DKX38_012119 [Salix brachista]
MDSSSPAETTTQSFGDLALTFGLSIGVLSVIAIGILVSYFCSRKPAPAGQSHHGVSLSINGQNSVTVEIGLSEATLNTCPKLLYSEAKEKLEKGADDLVATSCCSICLQDYKDSDLLRLLPECGHFFHAQCIDLWLKLHPTCPICRNSPVPEPINVTGTASGAPRRVLYDTWFSLCTEADEFCLKTFHSEVEFCPPSITSNKFKPHHTTGQIFNFGVFVGKTAMEVEEHFEILLHDVIEIESGRIELPSYKDEDSVSWTGEEKERFLIGFDFIYGDKWVGKSQKNVVVTKTPVQVSDHGYPPTGSCEEEDTRQMLHHLKIIGSLRLVLQLIICWRRCPLVFTLAGGRGHGRECRNRELELLSFSIGTLSSYPVV